MKCYDEILEVYQKFEESKNNGDNHEIYLFYLIKLMERLKLDKETDITVQNCILLTLNLFIMEDPDHYHSKGKTIEELNDIEKKSLRLILQKCYN